LYFEKKSFIIEIYGSPCHNPHIKENQNARQGYHKFHI
jgi:hypothetical protein